MKKKNTRVIDLQNSHSKMFLSKILWSIFPEHSKCRLLKFGIWCFLPIIFLKRFCVFSIGYRDILGKSVEKGNEKENGNINTIINGEKHFLSGFHWIWQVRIYERSMLWKKYAVRAGLLQREKEKEVERVLLQRLTSRKTFRDKELRFDAYLPTYRGHSRAEKSHSGTRRSLAGRRHPTRCTMSSFQGEKRFQIRAREPFS